MGDNVKETALSICVCGWYFWPGFINALKKIKHRVHIISHRSLTTEIMQLVKGIPIVEIDNIGLEWGTYDYFLKNIWAYDSNILFCHDDINVSDIQVFDKISLLQGDLVYIFKNQQDEIQNKGNKRHGSHGRALFMKKNLADLFLQTGGFYFDINNSGYIEDPTPEGVQDANAAIRKFGDELRNIKVTTGVAYYPEWEAAYRGKLNYTTRIEVSDEDETDHC